MLVTIINITCLNRIAKSVPVTKPVQDYDQNNASKQSKVQQSYNIGNTRYAPQKVENVQNHSKVEDSSAKIPACLNRQSSTLIYSSDSGDLGKEFFLL